MKKIWGYIILAIIGTLSLVGIKIPAAIATPTQVQSIEKINKTTPLYLQLGSDVYSPKGIMLVQHYSHYSHGSHGSHASHYSHYSSRY